MLDKDIVFLFRAGQIVPTMNTDVDPCALKEDEFQTLSNLRGSRGGLKFRGGIDAKNATGITSGTYRGQYDGYTNGIFRQLVAVETGGSTRLYYSPDTAFSELSGVAGKYPATRLASGQPVEFIVVQDTTNSTTAPFTNKSGRDLVVASDGVSVVVWDPVANECAVHEKVTSPSFGTAGQEATFPTFINLATSNIASTHVSDADVTVTTNATVPTYGTTPLISFATTATSNDFGDLYFTAGAKLATGKQFKVLYCCTDTEIWQKLKVTLYDGSSRVVYDPATDEPPEIIACTKGFSMAVFAVDPNAVPDNTHTRFTLTWVGASPVAKLDFYIIGLYGGGVMAGGTSLTLTRTNSGSRAESQSTTCLDKHGQSIRFLGVQDRLNDVPIPISADVLYSYRVTSDQPLTADINKGVDYILVYAQGPQDIESLHVHSEVLAAYAAGWAHSGGRSQSQKFSFTVNSDTPSLRRSPDDIDRPLMPFKSAAFSASRLYLAGVLSSDSGGTGKNNGVYFSWFEMPFRFRESVASDSSGIDPLSAGKSVIVGETPCRVVTLTGDGLGPQPVLVFTESAVWTLGMGSGQGSSLGAYELCFARKLAPHGTLSPRSVVVYMGSCYWLDQDKQVRVMPGTVQPLSKDRVSAVFNSIPDAYIANVSARVYRNFLYIAYTIGGGTQNTAVMVYDVLLDKWYRDVSNASVTFAGFFPKGDQLRFWSQAGSLFEHDSSNSDDFGTSIPYVITTREIGDLWTESSYGDVGIVCSDDSGKTMTAAWNGRVNGTNDSASKSIDVSTPMAYRWIQGDLTGAFGLNDVAASLSLTGTASGGKKILAIVARIKADETKAS